MKVGDSLEHFTLSTTADRIFDSNEHRDRGPLVLITFRGAW